MTQKFLCFAAAALLCLVSACSKKEIKPVSTEVEGPLSGAFTVVDEVYPIETEGDVSTVVIKLKRTDVSLPFTSETVGNIASPNDEACVLAGIGYNLLDAAGDEIKSCPADKNQKAEKEVLALLTLQPGETGTLTLTFNKESNPTEFKLTSDMKLLRTGKVRFDGAIGKYTVKNFDLETSFENGTIKGQYQYSSSPAGAFLPLTGFGEMQKPDNGVYTFNCSITEEGNGAMRSGAFVGKLQLTRDSKTSPYYYVLEGEFTNFNYEIFKFNLVSAPLTDTKEVAK